MEGGGPAQHTGQSRPISAPLSQIMQNDEQVQTTNWNTVLAVGTQMTYSAPSCGMSGPFGGLNLEITMPTKIRRYWNRFPPK